MRRASSRFRRSSASSDRQELRVVPWFLDEVAHATSHRFDSDVDRAPPGHDDHRQITIERLDASQQVDAFTARSGIAGVVEVHQQEVERSGAER